MAGSRGRGQLNWKAFISGLRGIVESLPTEAEKKEVDDKLTRIVEFIMDTQGRLAAIPAREQAGEMEQVLHRLDDLVAKAEATPTLRAALGLKEPRRTGASRAPFTEEEKQRAEHLLIELRRLPIDELRVRLEDDKLQSSRELEAVAGRLGIRVTSKTGRGTLINSIATKISNYRGYQHLRGEPEGPTKEGEGKENGSGDS